MYENISEQTIKGQTEIGVDADGNPIYKTIYNPDVTMAQIISLIGILSNEDIAGLIKANFIDVVDDDVDDVVVPDDVVDNVVDDGGTDTGDDITIIYPPAGNQNKIRRDWRNWNRKGSIGPEPPEPKWDF